MAKRLKNKKAVFFIGLKHHFLKLSPVADYLKRQGMKVCFLTGRNVPSLGEGNAECFELLFLREKKKYKHLYEYRDKSFLKDFKEALEVVEENIALDLKRENLKVFDFINPEGLQYTIEDALECRLLFERMIAKERPDILLGLHEANFWVKLMSQVAFEKKVPVLTFQEGLYTKTEARSEKYRVMACYSQALLWGEEARKTILAKDSKAKRNIILVGNPEYDALLEKDNKQEKITGQILKRLNITKEQKVVLLLLPNPYDRFSPSIPISAIAEKLASFKDTILLIKWHPREKVETINKYQKLKGKVKHLISGDIKEILPLADLCLVLDSSAGLDALVYEKPLIEVNIGNTHYGRSYSVDKVALLIDKKEKLSFIGEVLKGKKETYKMKDREVYLKRIFYKLDGKACERISDTIKGLINSV